MEVKRYKDLDLAFIAHPSTKDISVSINAQAIVKSVRNIILTQKYEKPFMPNFGSSVRSLLFEPVNDITAFSLKKEIELAITNYEPRVSIKEIIVTIRPDYNSYSVKIEFYIVNILEPLKVDFVLTRLR